jgi:hypothetical protein
MVISSQPHSSESIVTIPQYIAQSIKVPNVVNGLVVVSCIEDGDMAILVRQPCLWTGGIRPCRIIVTKPMDNRGTSWDVNSSMGLPISMCTPFAAGAKTSI